MRYILYIVVAVVCCYTHVFTLRSLSVWVLDRWVIFKCKFTKFNGMYVGMLCTVYMFYFIFEAEGSNPSLDICLICLGKWPLMQNVQRHHLMIYSIILDLHMVSVVCISA